MELVSNLGFGFLILVGLSLVVTIHEAGHFIAARWAGVEVEAFAIGWGKILWSWKPGTTEYRVCLLPLGGYCKMRGEQDLTAALDRPSGQVEASPGSLFGAPAWKRILISAAGPVFNLLTALVVFSGLALTGTPSQGPDARLLLASEVDGRTGTAAEAAGLMTGDLVVSVGGQPVRSFADLQAKIAGSNGSPMRWVIEREGARLEKTVVPQFDSKAKRSVVGVYSDNPPVVDSVTAQSPAALAGFQPGDRVLELDGSALSADQVFFSRLGQSKLPSHTVLVDRKGDLVTLTLIPEAPTTPLGLAFAVPSHPAQGLPPIEAVAAGFDQTMSLLGQMLQGLGRLFTGREDPVQSLTGPIGIVSQGTQAVSSAFHLGLDFGLSTFVNILAFLSLALFLMNLLPIPALDGGSILVSLFEGIRRRPLGIRWLVRYQQTGALIVLGLILFTTLNDMGLFGKL